LGVLLYEMLAGRPPFIDPLQSALLVKQATAAPPPLPTLRQDIQRPLALAVHSLLSKRPEDRPRTAMSAKTLLERSLVQPERTLPDIEPLSSMVAASSASRSVLFRVGAPLLLVAMFGGLLAWGYTGDSSSNAAAAKLSAVPSTHQPQIAPVSYKNDAPPVNPPVNQPVEKPAPASELTLEQARKIATKFIHGVLGSVQIVDTDEGQVIIAIDSQRRASKTTFLVIQKRAEKYRVTKQGPLDTKDFKSAIWTSEVVDADEDGYQEVLFSGRDAPESRNHRRFTLYVPNDIRTYSMMTTGETTAKGAPRIIWSVNASGTEAAAYRTALRQKAKTLVAKK
jgi:serine/threonine protein kinase